MPLTRYARHWSSALEYSLCTRLWDLRSINEEYREESQCKQLPVNEHESRSNARRRKRPLTRPGSRSTEHNVRLTS
jgi:hypothetical protein